MRLQLTKSVTTTETVEQIPSSIDANRFAQSERATERKMVIRAVIDPGSQREISLHDAVHRGVIDYSTGEYRNPEKHESMTIDEAIMKSLIRVEFVTTQTGQEKKKSFGTITVQDAETKVKTHYVVHLVTDTASDSRLDFDSAVEKQLLDLSDGTYWDSLRNEALSISDALAKGYLEGHLVEDADELEEINRVR